MSSQQISPSYVSDHSTLPRHNSVLWSMFSLLNRWLVKPGKLLLFCSGNQIENHIDPAKWRTGCRTWRSILLLGNLGSHISSLLELTLACWTLRYGVTGALYNSPLFLHSHSLLNHLSYSLLLKPLPFLFAAPPLDINWLGNKTFLLYSLIHLDINDLYFCFLWPVLSQVRFL